jgi:hypothetical protein
MVYNIPESSFRFYVLDFKQGCQIFLDTMYQTEEKYTQMTTKYTKGPKSIANGRKVFQVAINNDNVFHTKALQNLPGFEFLVCKQTIWQPRFQAPNPDWSGLYQLKPAQTGFRMIGSCIKHFFVLTLKQR